MTKKRPKVWQVQDPFWGGWEGTEDVVLVGMERDDVWELAKRLLEWLETSKDSLYTLQIYGTLEQENDRFNQPGRP